jgi:hypothetical protein
MNLSTKQFLHLFLGVVYYSGGGGGWGGMIGGGGLRKIYLYLPTPNKRGEKKNCQPCRDRMFTIYIVRGGHLIYEAVNTITFSTYHSPPSALFLETIELIIALPI